MTTIIESYLRINNEFIPIQEYSGTLPDKNYIEGAIVCQINGCDIFTFDHWDLIDQLWAYVLSGLEKVLRGQVDDGYFPDQPLRLRFEPISTHRIKLTVGDQSHNLDLQLFLSAIQRGAIDFFSKMKKLHPEAWDTHERYEKIARSLRPVQK